MPPSTNLFIASLGNPPPKYHNTLHSAGHVLLHALSTHLSYTPFTKSRPLASGLVSEPSPSNHAQADNHNHAYTLWQSPTLMNVSGPTLLKAYRSWLLGPGKKNTLILLHDELEASLGQLKVRRGGSREYSDRGHRGVRSVLQSFAQAGLVPHSASEGDDSTTRLVRIGVGIGRPESRERGDVSDYVLREMNKREMEKVEGAVGPLLRLLEAE
ncbi:aminoacyl-tRNA hydrolase [Arachnomyces sp. PD_36]|nr:aminoacyl-tRNA hydrolase [Arachnomyces sp. PD_36]